jgi:hypothetical protein
MTEFTRPTGAQQLIDFVQQLQKKASSENDAELLQSIEDFNVKDWSGLERLIENKTQSGDGFATILGALSNNKTELEHIYKTGNAIDFLRLYLQTILIDEGIVARYNQHEGLGRFTLEKDKNCKSGEDVADDFIRCYSVLLPLWQASNDFIVNPIQPDINQA